MSTRCKSAIGTGIALALFGIALGDKPVEDEALGLSKTSVFATPDPIVAKSKAGVPGENEKLGAYFSGAPPLISHQVEDFLPIRIGENLCLDCHLLPEMLGRETEAGEPTPIPASHYTDLRRKPGKVTGQLIGARFNCTQCHAPQADAAPLVGSSYRQ